MADGKRIIAPARQANQLNRQPPQPLPQGPPPPMDPAQVQRNRGMAAPQGMPIEQALLMRQMNDPMQQQLQMLIQAGFPPEEALRLIMQQRGQ